MGREIRRVEPHWQHPRWTEEHTRDPRKLGQYRSCHDSSYVDACEKWQRECVEWSSRSETERYGCRYYWEYAGAPPDEELHRPAFTAEPTWWQIYETVSEGSPVTPPFPTAEALIDHLVNVGDDYDGKWTRAQAEAFVKDGNSLPSMIFSPETGVVTGPALADLLKS